MPNRLILWLPVVVWCGVIFGFSSVPSGKSPDPKWWEFWYYKMAHVVEYAILYILVFRAKQSHLFAAVFVVIYGISDEFHQSFTPGRESNYLRDVGFDTLGGMLAGLSLWKLSPILQKKLKV